MTSVFDRDDFNRALFFPRGDASPPPPDAIDRFVEVDGARLHLRCHPAATARCTLLLFHGNGEVVADYDDSASEFARAGAALAVVDYRGYGRSTGVPTLRSVVADARAIALAIEPGPLVVMGRSLGGVAAHELYARPLDGMRGVVLESAFHDLGALVERRGLEAPTFTAEDRAAFDPAAKLPAGRLPLLVLHGARDQLIAPREATAAVDAAGSTDKRLVMVPGRGHNDISFAPEYWSALAAFVERIV